MNVSKFSIKMIAALTLTVGVALCASSASMTMGKAELKSAGQLAFGPDGILFVGDSMIDVETARAAGTRMCVVLYGFGHLRGELVLTEREVTARTPHEILDVIGTAEMGTRIAELVEHHLHVPVGDC